MVRVVGILGDALQLAILHHVERADRRIDVARKEIQHTLTQGWQGQFADDRLAELGLPGAVPGLLLKRLGMGLLALQRLRVALRQRGQVATTEVDEHAAEDQAEQQKAADQGGGDHLRYIGALAAQLAFAGDEIVEQTALILLQLQPALALHILNDGLPLSTLCDQILGKDQPLAMQHGDALDAFELLGVLGRVVAHQLKLLFEQRQFTLVGLEKARLAGDQVAAHRRLDVVEHLLRLVGIGHALNRTLDPLAHAQQVIDDGAEEEGAEKAETQWYGHIAVENPPEIALIDEGLAHWFPFRIPGAGG